VGLPSSFDQFREIWHIDFEYRFDANHLPVPVSLFAKEHRSGTEIKLRRPELLARRRAPFDTGPDVLVVSYSIVAELSCFAALSWPAPRRALCLYFETAAQINGLDIVGLKKKRPSLLEACDLFGIPHMEVAHKEKMRDLILSNVNYTENQWRDIEAYNRWDVLLGILLLEALASALASPIALNAALFRGRFADAVAAMEALGLPVDVGYLATLVENWQALRLHYIGRDDVFGLYDEAGAFHIGRLAALIEARDWIWQRTPTGMLELKGRVLADRAKRYPELKSLQQLRDHIAELRLGAFLNTVGADGCSRCPTMAYWTRSGRNQPQGRDKAFLLSLPSWVHGLIKPNEGEGIALLDWTGHEIGLVAGFSQDPALIADYQSGDIHMRFAVRANLAPKWATRESHGATRDAVKPLSLGSSYGITKYGVAQQSGKSLAWAAELLAAHRHAYPVFAQWREDVVTQALFAERIESPFGWPMAVHAGTSKRTLMNYPAQSGGADCMRLAAIAAYEAGIHIRAVAHDAFWISAPLARARRGYRNNARYYGTRGQGGGRHQHPGRNVRRRALAPVLRRRPQAGREGRDDVERSQRPHRRVPSEGQEGSVNKRPRLHLVGDNPTDVFDDLDKLRTELQVPMRRGRSRELFARIPHDWGLKLCQAGIGDAGWAVVFELDRIMLKSGRNPVRLWSARLKAIGVAHSTRLRALRRLEKAGAIKIERQGAGHGHLVTLLWYR
jgi:hypothetical protein